LAAMKETRGDGDNDPTQNIRDLLACHAAISHRIIGLLVKIDKSLQDLVAFLPLWLQAIERRRALLLRRAVEEASDPLLQ
jgi:hypothetical protein